MEFDEHAVEDWCQEAVFGVRDQLEHSPMWLCKDEKTWTKNEASAFADGFEAALGELVDRLKAGKFNVTKRGR